jgi:hypothetical protein
MTITRRWLWLASCLVLAALVPVWGQQPSPLPPALTPFVSVNAPIVALTHVRVVDGTGAPARTEQTVIVDGARIASVRPSRPGSPELESSISPTTPCCPDSSACTFHVSSAVSRATPVT